MIDFMKISARSTQRGTVEIYPKFVVGKTSDLMIRGGDFYAVWLEDQKIWSTDEEDVIKLIDFELDNYAKENAHKFDANIKIKHMWDSESGMIDAWHKYCQKQMRDHYVMLDEKLIFSNDEMTKKDYASKRLPYPLEKGSIEAFDKLMSVLYSPEERHKIEWAIGAVVSGDSKKIQKFLVLYGAAGTGKSTVLNIIQKLFDGYYGVFDAKALGSASNQFALESFRSNPLVAIQHDGDLSRIEDNTRLNSLVSHEIMTVNEKFAKAYSNDFKCFLFMGTNKPVKITDAKSGLIRRLIDVTPTGNKLSPKEYKQVTKQIDFELGAIAYHCRELYLSDKGYYDYYIPIGMLDASNDFYNFVNEYFLLFKKEDCVTLKTAWKWYKDFCDDARVYNGGYSQRLFKEELRNYFDDYKDRMILADGTRVRSYYIGFKADKFDNDFIEPAAPQEKHYTIELTGQESIFDKDFADCLAQYANDEGTPSMAWDKVTTKLSQLDTTRTHYVMVPENHIVIDFDIKDKDGNKSMEKNLEEASKWPPTYTELSKSGGGVHLHYNYTGDVTKLSRVYDDNIEIKVFTGKSSLRRRLSRFNNLPVAQISSGLPLKGESKMINSDVIKSEKGLRTTIKKCLNKEVHSGTKPNVDFIYKILEDAYNSGLNYDVSDMRNAVLAFAAGSTNQADYCIKLVNKMQFKSAEAAEAIVNDEQPIVFFDVEVFPNLFLINWKVQGPDKPIVRMINPTPQEVEEILKYRLVGFNCRRYDNHMLHARVLGYSEAQLYNLSQKIINSEKGQRDNGCFGEAYNISYTDIYDFAAKKQSLKKWEIELGIHHQELGFHWDQPVPEEKWKEVAEYCDNDVAATEAVWDHLSADFTARRILASLAGATVNDTTNSLTTKIIFGKEKKPQKDFCYRDMSKPVTELATDVYDFLKNEAGMPMQFTAYDGTESILPCFPGYVYDHGKSTYRGEEVGEGGYVYSEPGMYGNVALLDIASMHPRSTIAECLFGPEFTRAYREIVEGRVNIKHEAWDIVNNMLDGKLTPFIQEVLDGHMTSKDLANALKIAINSVYGLTAANFENPFRDPRNKDNIVAKRGALFMVDLKNEVQKRGFIVAHIKTDSIKIPDATPEIIEFVMDFGKQYGYTFEHEATYERMCLVNDAVYIAKYATKETCEFLYKYAPGDNEKHGDQWTATGTQFQVPYVFKTLFSKEPLEFDDFCETKSVKTALYLDMNEQLPDVSNEEKELSKFEEKYKKGLLSDITFEEGCTELNKKIEEGHNYIFIGKVGQFCPMKEGSGSGSLVSERDGKYYSATGAKGYRWMESEMVKTLGKEDLIDISYYDDLAKNAMNDIDNLGDYEWFVSDRPYSIPPFVGGKICK